MSMEPNVKYDITLLEYAVQKGFSNGCVFNGYFDPSGTRDVTYTIALLEGGGRKILIDTGYDDTNPELKRLADGCHITGFVNPVEVLERVGLKAEDITDIILTHAHWDHIGGVHLFPKAKFYIQKDELFKWIETLTYPRGFDLMKASMSYFSIENLISLLKEGRLEFLDGDADDLFPGISIRQAINGHTFCGSMVMIQGQEKSYIHVGDAAYLRDNIIGGLRDGVSIPNGYGIGDVYHIVKAMQDAVDIADGDLDRVIVGHEPMNWEIYPGKVFEDGLHMATVR